jgi:hypothetical protein
MLWPSWDFHLHLVVHMVSVEVLLICVVIGKVHPLEEAALGILESGAMVQDARSLDPN